MGERPFPVLLLCDRDRVSAMSVLIDDLESSGRFAVRVTSDPDRLHDLTEVRAVYADWHAGALTADQGQALAVFLEGGGGVVAAGSTLAGWAADPTIAGIAGWTPDGRTVTTELVFSRTDIAAAPVTESGFRLRGSVHLLPETPSGAEPLLTARWQYADQVVAYVRQAGRGRFVYIGLGPDARPQDHPSVRRLVRDALMRVVGRSGATVPLGVGLLGFGALGRAHAAAIEATDGLELRCICDRSPERRDDAIGLEVSVVADAADLYATPGVEVVLVGTPPLHHAEATLAALDAGKHVVCEKPFALSAADCDRMIERAAAVERVVTVYQNRRWDPDYVAMTRAIAAGAIGEPFFIDSFVGGYSHPCHYWHSHEPISGGALYDWGSHYIDWILLLVASRVVSVRGTAHKRVWHDVTNADQVSVELGFANGAQAFFMHSHVAAARKPKWYVLGEAGAIVADWRHVTNRRRGPDGELDEEAVLPTDVPARVRVLRPDGDGGVHSETLSLPRRDRLAFYRNLAAHLSNGEPLAVPAQQARRNVAIMEMATRSAAAGGALARTDI